jgi:hypothetical protein
MIAWKSCAAAALLLAASGTAGASTVADASYVATTGLSRLITGPVFQQVAQTFTVDRTGIFASVTIPVRHHRHFPESQDLRVSLMTVVNGLPGRVLASVDVAVAALDKPDFVAAQVDFWFARQLVRRGETFAIAAGSVDPIHYGTGNYIWQADSPGGYVGGNAPVVYQPDYAAAFGLPTGWSGGSGWDMGFATQVAPIPLPPTAAALVAALGGLSLLTVRVRRSGLSATDVSG